MQVLAVAAAQVGNLPGTISAARSSLASRNGCTGSLANAMFDVYGPTRPSSGIPDTSASTPNASLMVARYSARVRREKPDCRTPGTAGVVPPLPEELAPAPPPLPLGPPAPALPPPTDEPGVPRCVLADVAGAGREHQRDAARHRQGGARDRTQGDQERRHRWYEV